MKQLKVIVYAICKNEEKFVKRWMASMREADAVYVADTGSEDNTVALLRQAGAVVNEINVTPWRFDTARNQSLSFVPEDADICVCTDLDEVLEPGWRKALEAAWQPGLTTRARYHYTWSFTQEGKPDVYFLLDKVHIRCGYRWTHPVHEVLTYQNGAEHYTDVPGMQLNHYPDHEKSRAQYLPLLELSVKEQPDDDRNRHYLGREYLYYGEWDKCIATLQQHLAMPRAVWRDERAASMRYIARAFREKGELTAAQGWYYRAIAEAPYLREGYAEQAILAYHQGNDALTVAMVSEALKITKQPVSYISEGFCYDSTLYDIGSVCAARLGMMRQAAEWGEQALRLAPQDARIRDNVKFFYKMLENLPKL
ncbi:MAG: glycosyltransferase family 2 protein [Eubacterium sp.]|nr:glycosyltransferase family 2 protein [Eubacterium sp.]